MVIETEKINSSLIQALANAGQKTGGYSEVVFEIQSISQNLIPRILQNWDELYFEFISEETNFAIEIGVARPKERKVVVEMISKIGMANPNSQNMQFLALINQELTKNNATYRLPISLATNLRLIINKSIGITRGLKNLKLLSKQFLIEEVSAFVGKYVSKQSSEFKPLVDMLGQTLTKMGDNASSPEVMQKIAVETLLKIGYLKVGVEGKDPGQLANILFYEMVAAQGCLNAKNKKGQEDVSKDEVIDQVAIILVNALK